MELLSKDGITTRKDGLPFDVKKVAVGHYQFRAVGQPESPIVIATTKSEIEAIKMLVAQAPEDVTARKINELKYLLTRTWISDADKNKISSAIASLEQHDAMMKAAN